MHNSRSAGEVRRDTGRPLKLIDIKDGDCFSSTPTLHLHTDVLQQVLNTCQGYRICTITVTGVPRYGKTFLLNYIKTYIKSCTDQNSENWTQHVNVSQGFQWSHGVKKITRGIWIWSEAFIITQDEEKFAVLLLDTEGFDDESTSNDVASNILGLSLLCSSTTIFNFSGSLGNIPLDYIRPYLKYGKIHLQNCYVPAFEKILFLVRDWAKPASTLQNPFSKEGGQRLLKKKLDTEKEKYKDYELAEIFEKHECYLLPNIGERAKHTDFKGATSQMDSEFCKRLTTYIANIANPNTLSNKKIFGNDIYASEFGLYLHAYVNLFNTVRQREDFPQHIWNATYNVALELKHASGLTKFEMFFKEQSKRSNGGYIKVHSIDALKIEGKSDARETFQAFVVPVRDSQNLDLLFETKLETHFVKIKKANQETRQNYIENSVQGALDNFYRQIQEEYSFATVANNEFPDEVYYDMETMKVTLATLSSNVTKWFLDLFPTEPDDTREHLAANLQNKFEEIAEKHLTKNQENLERAKRRGKKIVQEFVVEYTSHIDQVVEDAGSDITASVLQVFHNLKKKDLERKFDQTSLPGDANLKKEIWSCIEDDIQKFFMEASNGLGRVGYIFERKMKNECAAYKQSLQEYLRQTNDYNVDEFKAYYQQSSKDIVQKIMQECPYPTDSPQHRLCEQSLSSQLDNAFRDLLTENDSARLEGIATSLGKQNLEAYEGGMKELLQDFELCLEPGEFEAMHKTCLETTVSAFDTSMSSVVDMTNGVQTTHKQILKTEIDQKYKVFQHKNNLAWEVVNINGENVRSQCIEEFRSKIMQTANEKKNLEELKLEFEQLQQQALVKFKNDFRSCSQSIINFHSTKLEQDIQTIFETDVLPSFSLRINEYNEVLKQAIAIAQTFYNAKMSPEFSAVRNAPIANDKLEAHHLNFRNLTAEHATAQIQLDDSQLEKLLLEIDQMFTSWKDKNEVNRQSFLSTEHVVGIDLGTTTCSLAIYHQGQVKIIENTSGYPTTPSYVTLNSDGTPLLVGNVSKEQAFMYPGSTIFNAKRIIGRDISDVDLRKDLEHFPFTVVGGSGGFPNIQVDNSQISPEKILSFLLAQLKQDAESFLNKPVNKAVITVPANFSDGQRQATKRAGEMAGFQVLCLLNEPSAAALAFRDKITFLNGDNGVKKIVVFDLGGGTFDVAVLEMSQKKIRVLSVNGDGHLGGEDFDKNLVRHCAQHFQQQSGVDLFELLKSENITLKQDAQRKLRRLQTACEKAKCQLSAHNTTSVPISLDSFHEGQDFVLDVTREAFEKMNLALFQRTINVVNETLTSANLKQEDVDQIVLVGGSTRIPKLREMLVQNFLGKPLSQDVNADVAVAYGAAIQAAILSANPDQPAFDFEQIREVTASSLGISDANGGFDVIIRKNTSIPVTEKRTYATSVPNQENVKISVYEGESLDISRNKHLRNFTMHGIPAGAAGEQQVEVSMTINSSGILEVVAVCLSTQHVMRITVDSRRTVVSNAEIRQLPQEDATA